MDYYAKLPAGAPQRQALCGRGNQDRFARWYCAQPSPTIDSLRTVLTGLALNNRPLFAANAASNSVFGRSVSSINPRTIIFSASRVDYCAVGYSRGAGAVEVIGYDPVKKDLNFYLVRYGLACDANRSCSNADRYLESNESGWTTADVYDDTDLKNTALDCLQCHQPGGTGTPRILRMQELLNPWPHWLRANRGSSVLLNQFLAAHLPGAVAGGRGTTVTGSGASDQRYAGIPIDSYETPELSFGDPLAMQLQLIEGFGFNNAPNVVAYDGSKNNGDDPNYRGPPDATWLSAYEQALAGRIMAPPHFGIDPFDPDKVEAAIDGYARASAGRPEQMPDVGALYRDGVQPFIGLVAPDAVNGQPLSVKQIVTYKCGTCHNGLFPGISRNEFVAGDFPDRLTPAQRAKVIDRINAPDTSPLRMPPALFGDLSRSQKEAIAGALQ
ncbi:MAG TPA: hypothetical protein VFH51_20515 [Myxococcota bacterium]|nr:hypothetical protein [Myxococcota bacterium]